MKISLNTKLPVDEINKTDGYGYATDRMLSSLDNLGYEVTFNDPKADVGIVFDQPQHAKYYGKQYKILYHPWESTKLLPGWLDIMNSVDEVWTPSPLIAQWYREYCEITRPVHVYQHGVDAIWSPHRRVVEDKFKFLHIGAESARKGWKETSQAFRYAFPTRRFSDVSLTYKVVKRTPVPKLPGTEFVDGRLSVPEMVELYHSHHVYVYPSWGEGFGLTPLQAMATAMPTITSYYWAPYWQFLDPSLAIGGTMAPSPWPSIHPGDMIKPSVDEIVDRMLWVVDNYDDAAQRAMAEVNDIVYFYSWDRLTDEAFSALEKRLQNN